jgi:hypothetical protein
MTLRNLKRAVEVIRPRLIYYSSIAGSFIEPFSPLVNVSSLLSPTLTPVLMQYSDVGTGVRMRDDTHETKIFGLDIHLSFTVID